jgi:hypothetical protein
METKLLPDAIEQLANEGVAETFLYVYLHFSFYRKRYKKFIFSRISTIN